MIYMVQRKICICITTVRLASPAVFLYTLYKTLIGINSEMNITGTLPQAGNVKLFVPSLSTQGSTRPKQNIFNFVLMRSDKTE